MTDFPRSSSGRNAIDIAMEDLRTVVETASRSEQRVIIDDFTGLE